MSVHLNQRYCTKLNLYIYETKITNWTISKFGCRLFRMQALKEVKGSIPPHQHSSLWGFSISLLFSRSCFSWSWHILIYRFYIALLNSLVAIWFFSNPLLVVYFNMISFPNSALGSFFHLILFSGRNTIYIYPSIITHLEECWGCFCFLNIFYYNVLYAYCRKIRK